MARSKSELLDETIAELPDELRVKVIRGRIANEMLMDNQFGLQLVNKNHLYMEESTENMSSEEKSIFSRGKSGRKYTKSLLKPISRVRNVT